LGDRLDAVIGLVAVEGQNVTSALFCSAFSLQLTSLVKITPLSLCVKKTQFSGVHVSTGLRGNYRLLRWRYFLCVVKSVIFALFASNSLKMWYFAHYHTTIVELSQVFSCFMPLIASKSGVIGVFRHNLGSVIGRFRESTIPLYVPFLIGI